MSLKRFPLFQHAASICLQAVNMSQGSEAREGPPGKTPRKRETLACSPSGSCKVQLANSSSPISRSALAS